MKPRRRTVKASHGGLSGSRIPPTTRAPEGPPKAGVFYAGLITTAHFARPLGSVRGGANGKLCRRRPQDEARGKAQPFTKESHRPLCRG